MTTDYRIDPDGVTLSRLFGPVKYGIWAPQEHGPEIPDGFDAVAIYQRGEPVGPLYMAALVDAYREALADVVSYEWAKQCLEQMGRP